MLSLRAVLALSIAVTAVLFLPATLTASLLSVGIGVWRGTRAVRSWLTSVLTGFSVYPPGVC